VHGKFEGEVRSDLREREEGIRIKHSVNGNSVKAYGKALQVEGRVFRVETTIGCTEDFKVYRRKEGDRKAEGLAANAAGNRRLASPGTGLAAMQ